ncbi:DUF4156 domain-containing protein, partial [Salmonella enterica subsp. enterica serovar Agona]|nr:DUF4156 domain-containing protein [Salmonella enterica subsp. enterica serovar Agona]
MPPHNRFRAKRFPTTTSSNELTAAGQNVRFVEDKPGAECQLIGTATGKQSNWFSGQHG